MLGPTSVGADSTLLTNLQLSGRVDRGGVDLLSAVLHSPPLASLSLPPPALVPFSTKPPGASYSHCNAALPPPHPLIHLSFLLFTAYGCPSLPRYPPTPNRDSCHCRPRSRSVLGRGVTMGSLLPSAARTRACVSVEGGWALCPSATVSSAIPPPQDPPTPTPRLPSVTQV